MGLDAIECIVCIGIEEFQCVLVHLHTYCIVCM